MLNSGLSAKLTGLGSAFPPGPGVQMRCSMLERLPKWLICVPLVVQWLWLSLRYGSATLPSAANPCITSGGLVGEGKVEYFNAMGPLAQAATAPWGALRAGKDVTTAELRRHLIQAGLDFPLIAKPDLGLCGHGVRKVGDVDELKAYMAAFPTGETVVLQAYLPQEGEAGIFYARDPETDEGRIIGLALRFFPRVHGNGRDTIGQLVAADPRLRRLARSDSHDAGATMQRIPARGEMVRLATIGSTRVGGLYRDGRAHITAQLMCAIDAIARDMPHFHFGRFDVRFDDVDALEQGRDFHIMEVNGAGSEAIEAWDPEIGLWQGLRMVFAKQRLLFAIGAKQRRGGVKPIGLLALARLNQRQLRLIKRYPPSN